jgi:hypothetical protein
MNGRRGIWMDDRMVGRRDDRMDGRTDVWVDNMTVA